MALQDHKNRYGISHDAETTVDEQPTYAVEQGSQTVDSRVRSEQFTGIPVSAMANRSFAISRDAATDDEQPTQAAGQGAQASDGGAGSAQFMSMPVSAMADRSFAISRDAETDDGQPAQAAGQGAQAADSGVRLPQFMGMPVSAMADRSFAISRDAETDDGQPAQATGQGAHAADGGVRLPQSTGMPVSTMANRSFAPAWNAGSAAGQLAGQPEVTFQPMEPNSWMVPAVNQQGKGGGMQPTATAGQTTQQVQFFDRNGGQGSAPQAMAPSANGPVFFSSTAKPSAAQQVTAPAAPAASARPSKPDAPISHNAHRAAPVPQSAPLEAVTPIPKSPATDRYQTYNEHRDQAQQQYDARLAAYKEQRKRLKQRIWIIPVALVTVAMVTVLIGALLSVSMMLLFLLLMALVVTILAVTGKLEWLKVARKPKLEKFEMEMPEILPVHSVHICLQSKNLATPVTITIRDAVQYIGSDDRICREPLHFKGISHQHLVITCQTKAGKSQYFVTDQGSKNGTKLNGQKLKPFETYSLNFGDVITIATLYEFQVCSDAQ